MNILVLGGDGYLEWPTALHLSALGHEITVADNLHEPVSSGQVVRPPTEEGSGDQAGVQIVLTGQPAAAHAITPDTPSISQAPRRATLLLQASTAVNSLPFYSCESLPKFFANSESALLSDSSWVRLQSFNSRAN